MVVSPDVVENILRRSDVKDLLLCKSVCKSWYSLISSPYFVKAHLIHNICNSNNNDVGYTRIAIQIPNHEDLYQGNRWKVIGSSNGLVCVSLSRLLDDDALILLINPWTREARELPMPTLPPKEITYDIGLSFGYDSSTDDYKIVMGINKLDVDRSLVQVFSLKSMTWKVIGHINYFLFDEKPGVLLNEALHWIADDYNAQKTPLVILSFDLSREEFKVIHVPDDLRYVVPCSTLGIFEDNLCMSCVDANELFYGICVRRNNKWELLPNDYEMKFHDVIHYMKIYDSSSPKKKRMIFFCDDKACLSMYGKHTVSAPMFVQSLLSPFVNSERPSHAGSAKVLREIEEICNLEGGENENFYL